LTSDPFTAISLNGVWDRGAFAAGVPRGGFRGYTKQNHRQGKWQSPGTSQSTRKTRWPRLAPAPSGDPHWADPPWTGAPGKVRVASVKNSRCQHRRSSSPHPASARSAADWRKMMGPGAESRGPRCLHKIALFAQAKNSPARKRAFRLVFPVTADDRHRDVRSCRRRHGRNSRGGGWFRSRNPSRAVFDGSRSSRHAEQDQTRPFTKLPH